jgi:hypothetical protein
VTSSTYPFENRHALATVAETAPGTSTTTPYALASLSDATPAIRHNGRQCCSARRLHVPGTVLLRRVYGEELRAEQVVRLWDRVFPQLRSDRLRRRIIEPVRFLRGRSRELL